MCYLTKKDYDSALACFTKAVELDARTPRYRANRAMALGMLGKYDEALAAYSTVLSPADAHHNLSILCRLRGDLDRANAESAQADALKNATPNALPVSAPMIPTPTPQG
jgi:tetratricopeptide (TPR) repeat protein